ncbi:MAG: adenylosuccinate lyase [Actinomycetota bacterium]
MIDRYCLPRMKAVWNVKNKYQKWLEIEILACEAQAKLGKIPEAALREIKAKARFDPERIDDIERETRHDVIAFLTNVAEHVGPASRFIHYGMTSSDILDTGLALQMVEAAGILIEDIQKLMDVLKRRAIEHKDTVMIGRTHGIHAEPITFGFKLALWIFEMKRNLRRLKSARETIRYGKISGTVGTYANVDPYVEEYVCNKLGLRPAQISTQILQRDRHAEFLTTLGIIASSLDKFATEIRNLQRSDILEVEEPFVKGQKGSSAMPHKRNPIICERISGLARVVRANAFSALENIPLWHERDISHSSVERVIIPDSTLLLDYMLNKFTKVMEGLIVYPENMRKNLEKTGGIIFSQRVLLRLVEKGLSREEAYRLVQTNAMRAWQDKENFKDLLLKNTEITKYLSPGEIEDCFDLRYYLRNIDTIFKRLETL